VVPLGKLCDLDISAASGLVALGGRIYVVADDDLALHAYRRDGAPEEKTPLFPGELPGDQAQRKAEKPDLEALFVLGPELLCAVGSGSRPSRNVAVIIPLLVPGEVERIDLAGLYEAMGRQVRRLNVEGAAISGDVLRLLHRGRDGMVFDVDLEGFLAAAAGTRPFDGGLIRAARRADLGAIAGVPLGFTDASPLRDGRIVFSAAAEERDDPYHDGRVTGCVIGLLDAEGRVDVVEPIDPPAKVEGIHAEPATGGDAIDLLLVCDADDPTVRSPLLAATWDQSGHSSRHRVS